MCITVEIDENGREKLSIATSALSGVLALFGFVLLLLAVFIKVTIDDKMILMSGYDPDILPSFLLTVGAIMLISNLALAKISYDCGYPDTRGRFQNLLILFLLYLFVIIWFIFAASMMCFAHSAEIKESMENGIYGLMRNYHNDKKAKVLLDRLQLDYHCCGSKSYTDWIKTHWINHKYVNVEHQEVKSFMKNGKLIKDDVPFSCCDYKAPRPCVHHNINNKEMHVRNSLTLSKTGCTNAIMHYFDNVVLLPVGYSILTAFFVQIVLMLMLRLVQTSIHSALEMEDPVGIGMASIIPDCPCECCRTGDPMKYVKHQKKKKKKTDDDDDDEEPGDDDGGGGWGDWGGGDDDGGGGGGGGDDGGGGGGDDKGEKKKKDKKQKEKKEKGKKEKSKSKKSSDKKKKKQKSEKSKKKSPKSKKKSPKSKKKSPKSKKKSPKSKKKSPKSKKGGKSPKRSSKRSGGRKGRR